MNKLIAIVSLISMFAFNANAGLIASEELDDDGNLIVEFHFNNVNPELTDFGFELAYDTGVLTWDELFGDDEFGFQPNYSVMDYVSADGEDLDLDGVFDVFGFFEDGWLAEIGTDVFLGSAKFFVYDDLADNNFDITLGYALDIDGFDIVATAAEVPEPPAIALFGMLLMALAHKRRKRLV